MIEVQGKVPKAFIDNYGELLGLLEEAGESLGKVRGTIHTKADVDKWLSILRSVDLEEVRQVI